MAGHNAYCAFRPPEVILNILPGHCLSCCVSMERICHDLRFSYSALPAYFKRDALDQLQISIIPQLGRLEKLCDEPYGRWITGDSGFLEGETKQAYK